MAEWIDPSINHIELVAEIIEDRLDQWLCDAVGPSQIGHRLWAIEECAQQIVDVFRKGESR
jgi:hypothetical protein